MADITAAHTQANRGTVIKWETVSAANAALPIQVDGKDISVQMVGTWDGAAISLEGSNDGTNYAILENVNGDAITLSANGFATVQARPRYIKPVITTAGSGGVDVDVFLFVTKL